MDAIPSDILAQNPGIQPYPGAWSYARGWGKLIAADMDGNLLAYWDRNKSAWVEFEGK